MQDNDKEYVFCKDYTGKRYIVPLDLKFIEGYPDKDGWYTTYIEPLPEAEDAWVILHCFEQGKVDCVGFFVDTTHPEDVKGAEMVDFFDPAYRFLTPTHHAPLQWWLPEVQDMLEVKYGLKELQDNIPVLDEVVAADEPWRLQLTQDSHFIALQTQEVVRNLFPEYFKPTLRSRFEQLADRFRNACIAIYVKVTGK
jgi:hypothetical protein